jgi:hypothetical protein
LTRNFASRFYLRFAQLFFNNLSRQLIGHLTRKG